VNNRLKNIIAQMNPWEHVIGSIIWLFVCLIRVHLKLFVRLFFPVLQV